MVVVRAGEETDSAVNKCAFLQIKILCRRIQNLFGKTAHERKIGIVGLGAVDDDSLQVVVPSVGTAEQAAQVFLCESVVSGEAVNKSVANVVEDVGRVGVAAVVGDAGPDVANVQVDELFHSVFPPKIKKAPNRSSGL